MSQTDVLVTDFSSCYNDFLALNRPIIFYAFDYEDYLIHDRDYYWKYDKINAGYTCKSKDEFTNALMNVSKDFQDTLHQSGRLQMREIYFDHEVEMGTTREKLTSLIGQLIDGTYTPYDWTKNNDARIRPKENRQKYHVPIHAYDIGNAHFFLYFQSST